MTQPTQYQVLDADRVLTNLSIANMANQDNFIAGRVFPTVPVNLQASKFKTYKSGDFDRTEMRITADGSPAPLTGFGYGEDNYFCDTYKLGAVVGNATIANASSPLQPLQETTMLLTRQAMIYREERFYDAYIKEGVWATDAQGVASGATSNQFIQFSNYTTSDPISVMADRLVQFSLLNAGTKANKLLITRDVFNVLKNHPSIIERIIYIAGSEPAIINEKHLSALFEVEVMVLDAVRNTSLEGVDASYSFFKENAMLLLYAAPTAGLMTDSAGFIFSWTAFSGYGGSVIKREDRRLEQGGGKYLEIEQSWDMKLRNANMGMFFYDVIA